MRVVEAGNHRALLQVDHAGGIAAQGHGLSVAADGDEAPVLDGHGAGLGFFAVDRVQAAVVENEIGTHVASR